MTGHISYHRYVPHHKAEDYLRLGWVPRPTLEGTHHGTWAVHLEWLCCCGREVTEPQR